MSSKENINGFFLVRAYADGEIIHYQLVQKTITASEVLNQVLEKLKDQFVYNNLLIDCDGHQICRDPRINIKREVKNTFSFNEPI